MSSPVAELTKFAVVIGAVDGWYRYLVQSGLALGVKWAKDAGLLDPGFEYAAGDPENTVIRFLRELLTVARYICFHDDLVQLSARLTNPKSCSSSHKLESVLSESRHAALYLRNSRYGITPAELKETIGVFYTDAIPETLEMALQRAVDNFDNTQIKELLERDTRVIVDPSSSLHFNDTPFQSEVFVVREDDPRILSYDSHLAWIPTVFDVSSDGSETRAQSYITGLGPRPRHPKLYSLIEQTLALALPMLERTLVCPIRYGTLKREALSPSARRWKERAELRRDSPYVFKCRWDAVLRKQERQRASDELRLERDRRTRQAMARREREDFDPATITTSPPTFSAAGNKAHVVTKVVTHTLGPGESYENDWQTGGLPHDRILACAVHCFQADPGLEDVTMSFRRLRREYYDFPSKGENYQDEFWFRLTDGDESEAEDAEDYDCPSDWEDDWSPGRLPFTIPLGRIRLREKRADGGRIVTFPNWIQHKLYAKNGIKSPPSQLKLLYFFLVEDSQLYKNSRQDHVEITRGFTYDVRSHINFTTSNVPYPIRDCNLPTLHFLLPIVSERLIGQRLPPEIVEMIVTSLDVPGAERGSGLGMSRHEIERRRRNWRRDAGAKADLEREIWDPPQRFRLRSVDDI